MLEPNIGNAISPKLAAVESPTVMGDNLTNYRDEREEAICLDCQNGYCQKDVCVCEKGWKGVNWWVSTCLRDT